MADSNILPERLQEKVQNMPETSYGATRVVVILDDGTRIGDVYVAWGNEIVKVGEKTNIEFDVSKIVDVGFQKG